MASATETAWEEIFLELDLRRALESTGLAYVTADEIKTISGHEPRLMTKFDTRECRPTAIKKSNCTILPVQNGRYALVRGDGYCKVADTGVARSFLSPRRLQLETFPRECQSEAQAIDAAYLYGILHDFLGDDEIALTMRGRRRTPRFDFSFAGPGSPRLSVDGVQVEIDSGYEGDRVYVLEAKMGIRDNFIVRQLFYPARMCAARGVRKKVVPLFMTYSNQNFAISEYDFEAHDVYSSIQHIRSATYLLETSASKVSTLREILATTKLAAEPIDVPFPQANDMRKVIDVVDAVVAGVATKEAITARYEFAERQASYYGDAACYLGLLVPRPRAYALTPDGGRFAGLPARRKLEAVIRAMATRPVLRPGLEYLDAHGSAPAWDFFIERIASSRPDVAGSTLSRRAQATARWIAWAEANTQVGG